jgi:hypothetical protein
MAGVFVGMFVLAVLAAGLWYQNRYPRQILSIGSIDAETRRGGGKVRLRTRDVQIAATVFQEIEMPNGTWIPCAGDCRRAAFEAGDGLWEKIDKERR